MKAILFSILLSLIPSVVAAQENIHSSHPLKTRIGLIYSHNIIIESPETRFESGYLISQDKNAFVELGLTIDQPIFKNLVLNSGLIYAFRDFTAIKFFDIPVCPPNVICISNREFLPFQEFNSRLLKLPISLKYYPINGRFKTFFELGYNNFFGLKQGLNEHFYSSSGQFGMGIGYQFSKRFYFESSINPEIQIVELFPDAVPSQTSYSLNFKVLKSF